MNSIYFQNSLYYNDPVNYTQTYHQPHFDVPYLNFNEWISINEMIPLLKQRILSYIWKHNIGNRDFEDINLTYEAMELDKYPLNAFRRLENFNEPCVCPFDPQQIDYIQWTPSFDMTMSIFSKWIIIIRIIHTYPQIQAIDSYERLLEMYHSSSSEIIKLANDLNLFQFSIKAILQYSLDYNIAITHGDRFIQSDCYEGNVVHNYYGCDTIKYYPCDYVLENGRGKSDDFNFQINHTPNRLPSEDQQVETQEYNPINPSYYAHPLNSNNDLHTSPSNTWIKPNNDLHTSPSNNTWINPNNELHTSPSNNTWSNPNNDLHISPSNTWNNPKNDLHTLSSPSNTWYGSEANNEYSEAETQTPSNSDYSDDLLCNHLSKYKKICPFKIQEDNRDKHMPPKPKLPRGTPRKNLQATESKMYLHNKGYFRVMWWEENLGKRTRKEKIFPNSAYKDLGEAEQAARDFKAIVDAQLSKNGKVSILSKLTKSSSRAKKGSKRAKSEDNYELDTPLDDIDLEHDGVYLEWYPNISIPLGEKGRNSLKKALNKKRSEDTEYCDYLLMKNNLPFLQSSTFGYFTLKDLLHAANILGLWPLAQKFCIKYCKEMGFQLSWLNELRSKGIAVTFHELKKLKAQHLENEILQKKADLLLEDIHSTTHKQGSIKMVH